LSIDIQCPLDQFFRFRLRRLSMICWRRTAAGV